MDPIQTTVGGTYREGRIVLDRPMNWAEGTRVVVELLPEDQIGLIDGVWPADGSPSGEAEILRRMEEADKIPIEPGEAEDFEAAMEELRQFDLECLKKQKDPSR